MLNNNFEDLVSEYVLLVRGPGGRDMFSNAYQQAVDKAHELYALLPNWSVINAYVNEAMGTYDMIVGK